MGDTSRARLSPSECKDLIAGNARLRAENAALKAAAKGDAWRLLEIANEEIVNLKDEIAERDWDYANCRPEWVEGKRHG